MVTAEGPTGATYDFVVGLGRTFITETGASRMGSDLSSLTLQGVRVQTDGAQTVPDSFLPTEGGVPSGVIGGETFNNFDLLIDLPNGHLILKPVGRSVRWDGVTLSSPVPLTIYHDVMIRTDVELEGDVFGAFLELVSPVIEVNATVQLATGVQDGRVDSFRMGYAGWPELPIRVTDNPGFPGWDRDGQGFVFIGAAVARGCAIAISWAHQEMRTCLR